MKRLYAIPAQRGQGVGRVLAEGIIAEARRLGYQQMLLDTLEFMREAQALYRSLGFVPTAAYFYRQHRSRQGTGARSRPPARSSVMLVSMPP